MSGMIMLRTDGGIIALSDGGLYEGEADFTVTGFRSKPMCFPHIPAVLCMVGSFTLRLHLDYHCVPEWLSFDDLVERIRDDLVGQVEQIFLDQPHRQAVSAMVFLGGFSEARQRWETYQIQVETQIEEYEGGVGPLHAGQEVMVMPMPDPDALARYGFDPAAPDIGRDDGMIRLMRAMRATPQYMGRVGDDAEDAMQGYTIGGFIERVILARNGASSEIVWRWPDKVGEMIDPDDEGEPA